MYKEFWESWLQFIADCSVDRRLHDRKLTTVSRLTRTVPGNYRRPRDQFRPSVRPFIRQQASVGQSHMQSSSPRSTL